MQRETVLRRRTVDVLVAHDDQNLRHFLNAQLWHAGYNVRLAGNAVGASVLILEAAPDVMIVDVEMQGMDVFKFIAGVRGGRTIPFFPVIFVAEDMAAATRVREFGAACLLKPVQADKLLAVVASSVSAPPPPLLRAAQPASSLAAASEAQLRRGSRAQVL
jgi:two-component system phosphate regulon response regulator PhoB